jgi:hypothetical protein
MIFLERRTDWNALFAFTRVSTTARFTFQKRRNSFSRQGTSGTVPILCIAWIKSVLAAGIDEPEKLLDAITEYLTTRWSAWDESLRTKELTPNSHRNTNISHFWFRRLGLGRDDFLIPRHPRMVIRAVCGCHCRGGEMLNDGTQSIHHLWWNAFRIYQSRSFTFQGMISAQLPKTTLRWRT